MFWADLLEIELVKPGVVINWLVDCMTVLAVVGAVSIWPSEIGVLYVVCLCVAVCHRGTQRNSDRAPAELRVRS